VSAAVVADVGRGAKLIMIAPQADDTVITSNLPDICDVSLDQEAAIGVSGLASIMRGITVVEGEPGSVVSAFNSSI
jgi:hypothetical protein